MLVNLWGHEARTVYDGEAALEMAVVLEPDVVLLDLSMPKMDGCQVARQLRQQTTFADTLLIAVTGWTDQAHRLLCNEAGFDYYLLKPIDLAVLELLLWCEACRLAQWSEQLGEANGTGGDAGDLREEDSHSRRTHENGGSTMLVLTRKKPRNGGGRRRRRLRVHPQSHGAPYKKRFRGPGLRGRRRCSRPSFGGVGKNPRQRRPERPAGVRLRDAYSEMERLRFAATEWQSRVRLALRRPAQSS